MTDAPRIFSPEYYERMRLLESDSWWNAGMRDIAAKLLENAGLPVRGLLLDIGCGSGQTMAWFLGAHAEWTAAGIDVSVDGITAARALGLDVVHGDALHLPFATGSADLLICLDVLQHLPLIDGDRKCLAEMTRVLRPGGAVFIRTNCQSIPRTTDDPKNDFRKYVPGLLSSRLREAGFDVVVLSRANALLSLAELAREMRATMKEGSGYHGILSHPRKARGWGFAAKRSVLRAEGVLIESGIALPAGRSIVALCRKPVDSRESPAPVGRHIARNE